MWEDWEIGTCPRKRGHATALISGRMSDLNHQQLLGHLLGALDDAEQERVEARLESDPQWRRGLADWRRRLRAIEAMRPDFEPPPGLTERTCRRVADCAPAPADVLSPRRGISPLVAPPHRRPRLSWSDVAVAVILVLTTTGVLLPAIHGSRFHARVASCQDSLRQFGEALTQYGQHRGQAVSRLADGGRLTPAGLAAVERLSEGFLADPRQPVCPNLWLVVQGWLPDLPRPEIEVCGEGSPCCDAVILAAVAVGEPPGGAPWDARDWPGTRRDGTTSGPRFPPRPADLPFVADAPSADRPGQVLHSHGGAGRNVLYRDLHFAFVPHAMPRSTVDLYLIGGGPATATPFGTPGRFVDRR
jgi:hypothetical protein